MAIGQLINEIYFHPIVIDNSREEIVKVTIFTMQQKFYPLISIYLLISALSCGADKIDEYIIKAKNNKYFRKEDIKVIWASVYLYAMRIINDQNKNNIKIWIRMILNKFDSKSLIKKDTSFINQIKNFFNLLIS
jgi:hypothetical protein